MYTDDPIRDFERYDQKQEEALDKLPRCSICDRQIQDDYLYVINDELICEKCLERDYRKETDDYIE